MHEDVDNEDIFVRKRKVINRISKQKIFYTVLDWGLGHASRSVPLIQKMIDQDNEVIIASSGKALEFLKSYFPNQFYYALPSYNIKYYKNLPAWLSIVLQLHKIKKVIKKENEITSLIHDTEKFDIVISDSRYGTFVQGIHNVIISHQTVIHAPFFYDEINHKHRNMLCKFNEIWIPDKPTYISHVEDGKTIIFEHYIWSREFDRTREKERLYTYRSGFMPFQFIGWLSIWEKIKIENNKILILLSGPEPLRTVLEKKLVNIVDDFLEFDFIMVRGTNKPLTIHFKKNNVVIHNVMNKSNIKKIVSQCSLVICRSGYSSMMDIASSGRKGILIPTPGQWEQEALGEFCPTEYFKVIKENNLNKETLFNAIKAMQV